MPKIIPTELKKKGIVLILQGYPRDEIAKKTGLSTGTISNIRNRFAQEIGEANYEVLETFARFLRKEGINYNDAIEGFRTSAILKRLGVDDEKLFLFIEKIYNESQKRNVNAVTTAVYAEELFRIQKESGIPLQKIPKKYSDLKNDVKELEKNQSYFKEEVNKARVELCAALNDKKVTKERLNDYMKTKTELEKLGVSLNELSKLARMINHATQNGWRSDRILKHLATEEDYKTRIEKAKKLSENLDQDISGKVKQRDNLRKTNESLKKENLTLEARIKTLQKEEAEIKTSYKITEELYQKKLAQYTQFAQECVSKIELEFIKLMKELVLQLKAEINSYVKNEKNQLQKVYSSFDELIAKIVKTAEEIGMKKSFGILLTILDPRIRPQEIKLDEVNVMLMTFFERYKSVYQLKPNHHYRTILHINQLVSDLKEELNENK